MSSSTLPVQPVMVQKIGVKQFVNRVTNKANEYFRLLSAKCPPYGELPTSHANIAKVMICVELACLFHNMSYDKTQLMKLSGVSQQDYFSSLNLVRNILDIKPQIQFSTLCKEFGCPGMSNAAERCLEMYKKSFLEKMNGFKDKTRVDFSAPAYRAVAFYITARHLKYKVDKNKLMEFTNCPYFHFQTVLTSMTELCDMKNLIVTDSMNDIKSRIVETRKKKLEKEKQNEKQPVINEAERSAQIEAQISEMIKKNRYMNNNTELSHTSVQNFMGNTTGGGSGDKNNKKKKLQQILMRDSQTDSDQNLESATGAVNISEEQKSSEDDKITTTASRPLKRRCRPSSEDDSTISRPQAKKMKQLVLTFFDTANKDD